MSTANGNTPAMPVIEETKTEQYNGGTYTSAQAISLGLTKREQFAMVAMQGLLVNMGRNGIDSIPDVCAHAVHAADSLLSELECTK